MFIYYQRSLTGSRWTLVKSAERPALKSPEGQKRRIRQITELPRSYQHLPFPTLERMYPLVEPGE